MDRAVARECRPGRPLCAAQRCSGNAASPSWRSPRSPRHRPEHHDLHHLQCAGLRRGPSRIPSVVTVQNTSSPTCGRAAAARRAAFRSMKSTISASTRERSPALPPSATGGGDQTLGDDDTPASWVSGNYFSLLGVEMALGRGFLPHEDDRRFAGRRGRAELRLLDARARPRSFDRRPHAGVRRPSVHGGGGDGGAFTGTSPDRVDVWLPMASTLLVRPDDRWTRRSISHVPAACGSPRGWRRAPTACAPRPSSAS